MIGALSDWLRHLVMILLLAVFVDLILPSTSLQKYVRTVLGFVVMLTMLTPITALMTAHFHLSALEERISGPLAAVNSSEQMAFGGSGSSGNTAFATDLAATLREQLSTGLDVTVSTIQVQTETRSDGTPIVTAVYTTLGPLIPSSKSEVVAKEVQAQIAESLGLPLSAVHVSQ
ncbi:stage III sporulation protein AF [Sulfoacidibacillus thermotolerans]|uniref:Stage III sporulation protein AF n=1 Tax=Sulfoacidibacillus thermotolerans TaxID=1765684 RepID=A0A2U3DBY5_SULT2|nr:stage III sporulation protein AF [Sulfoacidibacillus thermotolerans]PWI58791.1 stage III sporulation protein AF [Sulfoacidibacillus thermotolerans]